MKEGMLEHLQLLLLSLLFNPAWLGLLLVCFAIGWLLGKFIPEPVVRIMLLVYLVVLFAKFFLFHNGYDLFFLTGLPFVAGLWQGARKWSC